MSIEDRQRGSAKEYLSISLDVDQSNGIEVYYLDMYIAEFYPSNFIVNPKSIEEAMVKEKFLENVSYNFRRKISTLKKINNHEY